MLCSERKRWRRTNDTHYLNPEAGEGNSRLIVVIDTSHPDLTITEVPRMALTVLSVFLRGLNIFGATLIGRGHFSEVYSCRDSNGHPTGLVVKVAKTASSLDSIKEGQAGTEAYALFLGEMCALSGAQSPFVRVNRRLILADRGLRSRLRDLERLAEERPELVHGQVAVWGLRRGRRPRRGSGGRWALRLPPRAPIRAWRLRGGGGRRWVRQRSRRSSQRAPRRATRRAPRRARCNRPRCCCSAAKMGKMTQKPKNRGRRVRRGDAGRGAGLGRGPTQRPRCISGAAVATPARISILDCAFQLH